MAESIWIAECDGSASLFQTIINMDLTFPTFLRRLFTKIWNVACAQSATRILVRQVLMVDMEACYAFSVSIEFFKHAKVFSAVEIWYL